MPAGFKLREATIHFTGAAASFGDMATARTPVRSKTLASHGVAKRGEAAIHPPIGVSWAAGSAAHTVDAKRSGDDGGLHVMAHALYSLALPCALLSFSRTARHCELVAHARLFQPCGSAEWRRYFCGRRVSLVACHGEKSGGLP